MPCSRARRVLMLGMLAGLGGGLLSGCAKITRPLSGSPLFRRTALDPSRQAFFLRGRMKLQADNKSNSARFLWAHQPQQEIIQFLSPLGSTVARLTIFPDRAILEDGERKREVAQLAELTQDYLGIDLPLGNIFNVFLGRVDTTELDGLGRPRLAIMGVWHVEYVAYADADKEAMPRTLKLTGPRAFALFYLDNWTWAES